MSAKQPPSVRKRRYSKTAPNGTSATRAKPSAEHLIADKGFDSDAIVALAEQQGMRAVIPPRKHRKVLRDYDRHLVENAFLHIKQWRGIATRYAKRLSSFLAAAQIRCLVLWLRIS